VEPAALDQISGYWYADGDTRQSAEVLNALRVYRSAEAAMRRRTRDSMGMNETDLLALRYLLAAQRQNRSVTPKELAHRLGISSASTTVLIDRLSKSGHVERRPHPTDRRALIIVATVDSDAEVRHTLGGMHERMLAAADRLSPRDAAAVIAFLDELRAAVDEVDASDASES
jgi:DNA-binding MarR family transcriptional regulator